MSSFIDQMEPAYPTVSNFYCWYSYPTVTDQEVFSTVLHPILPRTILSVRLTGRYRAVSPYRAVFKALALRSRYPSAKRPRSVHRRFVRVAYSSSDIYFRYPVIFNLLLLTLCYSTRAHLSDLYASDATITKQRSADGLLDLPSKTIPLLHYTIVNKAKRSNSNELELKALHTAKRRLTSRLYCW
jgi:hypothetical protein